MLTVIYASIYGSVTKMLKRNPVTESPLNIMKLLNRKKSQITATNNEAALPFSEATLQKSLIIRRRIKCAMALSADLVFIFCLLNNQSSLRAKYYLDGNENFCILV